MLDKHVYRNKYLEISSDISMDQKYTKGTIVGWAEPENNITNGDFVGHEVYFLKGCKLLYHRMMNNEAASFFTFSKNRKIGII